MASKKSKKGKRYTDAEKKKIVDFVNSYNAENGRGGAANASKKFGVSQLTVGSWLKAGKTSATKTTKRAAKKAGKRGRPAKVAVTGDRTKTLAALAKADKVIAAKRKELDALEAKFEQLKASL